MARIQEDDRPRVTPWYLRNLTPEQLHKRVEKLWAKYDKKQAQAAKRKEKKEAQLAKRNEKLLKKREKKQSLKSNPQNV
jgi:hypothetical protein